MSADIFSKELALRGFDITAGALELDWVCQNESYVRARVLARAREDLAADAVRAAPIESVRKALSRHENLLSGFEHARARAWLDHADPELTGPAIYTLLHGDDELSVRLEQFLELARPAKVDTRKIAGCNATVASYLLAMAHPTVYAFVKPERAFNPAWALLADPDAPPLRGGERVVRATKLYAELRELWEQERGFDGDLLDVHTRLYLLGCGGIYTQFSWARAVELTDIIQMVRASSKPSWRGRIERARASLIECCYDPDRPEDPYHGISLEDYAHAAGVSSRSLAWVIEHGTRELAPLDIDNADVFGVSAGRDGSWRVSGEDGVGNERAEAYFETLIKPRLKELAGLARVIAGADSGADILLLADEYYRALDAKILLVTLAALDPDWCFDWFAPMLNTRALGRLLELLGMDACHVSTLTDYLDAQAGLRARLAMIDEAERIAACELVFWATEAARGQLLMRLLEPEPELVEEVEGHDASEDAGGEPGAQAIDRGDSWSALLSSLPDPSLERIARLVRARKNVVLYGPPGTGKTVLSTQLAGWWRRWQERESSASPSVEQVTFHPSYGYEEFIEGFKPDPENPGQFALRDGLLATIASRAQREPHRQFLLLIDELNRGDVARIFGELITLIEADKRSREHARRRMLSQRPLWLPPNLYVLATMNTADKSISMLDVAIRRRFAFERVGPRPKLLDHTPGLVHEVQGVYMSALLEALNTRLGQVGVYPERWLGHSFLWLEQRDIDDPVDALSRRLRLDIIPLVEEYCFADRSQMKQVLGRLVSADGRPNERVLSSHALLDVLRELIEDSDQSPGDHAEGAP